MSKCCFIIGICLLVCIAFPAHSQQRQRPEDDGATYVEVSFLPALIYNSLSLGLSFNSSPKAEHSINLTGGFIPIPEIAVGICALRYNYNLIVVKNEKRRNYVPFWVSSRYIVSPGYDELEGSEILLGTLGSGYGWLFSLSRKHRFRLELGGGASVFAEKRGWGREPGIRGFKINSKSPVAPAFRLSVRYVFRCSK